jgi:N-acetyl-gamma-glutamyl-phosphate reductase
MWLAEVCPENDLYVKLEPFDADAIAERSDAAIVGYPQGAAAPVVAELRERGLSVVDLSPDNRLSAEQYRRYYNGETIPELLAEAVYGLTELHRDEVRRAELVANPGCYATAAILALAPLREHIAEVVIDGKSGVSGAGRNAAAAADSQPYQVSGHPHIGELEQELGEDIPITFVPHLSPEHQGLLVSCYVRPSTELTQAEVDELYGEAYAGERFVKTTPWPPSVDAVKYTNQCHVHAKVNPDTGLITAFAAIDNLWKGAAGQAVQNLNLMTGRPETEGLTDRQ